MKSPPLKFPNEPSTPSRPGGPCEESSLVPLIPAIDGAKKSVMIGTRELKIKEVRTCTIIAASDHSSFQIILENATDGHGRLTDTGTELFECRLRTLSFALTRVWVQK